MFTEIFIEWIIVAIIEVCLSKYVDASPMTVIGTVIATFIVIMLAYMFAIYKNYRKEKNDVPIR